MKNFDAWIGKKEIYDDFSDTRPVAMMQALLNETEKQLAIINAEREKGRAEIEKQTAELLRDKASITAQATKITADAEAYARKAARFGESNRREWLRLLERYGVLDVTPLAEQYHMRIAE